MTDKYLELSVRLLIGKYGRSAIIGAIATATEKSLDLLEEEVKVWGASKTPRKANIKPTPQLIAEACAGKDDIAGPVAQLVTQYENRQFLPRLSDVERFLERAGFGRGKLKSKRLALSSVVQALAKQSKEELAKLTAPRASSGHSDYAILAKAIMGDSEARPNAPSEKHNKPVKEDPK